jgi:alginate O-acetyltransferase complex protein AlgI
MAWIAALLAIALFCPNTQELMRMYEPALDFAAPSGAYARILAWGPSVRWALAIGVLAVAALAGLDRVTPFLYFQF